MDFTELMEILEEMGTAHNVKTYKRHGSGDNLFGVSFANLNNLKKKIKVDHNLACQLWATGNTDAMFLATMIADPAQLGEKEAEAWAKDCTYYMMVDIFAWNLISKTPFARKKIDKWTKSKNEWIGRAGWQILSRIAMDDTELPDDYFENYL